MKPAQAEWPWLHSACKFCLDACLSCVPAPLARFSLKAQLFETRGTQREGSLPRPGLWCTKGIMGDESNIHATSCVLSCLVSQPHYRQEGLHSLLVFVLSFYVFIKNRPRQPLLLMVTVFLVTCVISRFS